MKKMKQILCLGAAVVLAASLSMTAMAATGTYTATYDGSNKIKADFTDGEIAQALGELLPGESASFDITVKNAYSTETIWYLTNEVVESLEASSNGSGGAYTYKLTYSGMTEPIYDSTTVGGTTSAGADSAEGLNEATNATGNRAEGEWLKLGNLKPNETGVVTLEVGLDGETIVNDYQNTIAAVELNFAVEQVTGTTTTNRLVTLTGPKTGDTMHLIVYSAVALGAGLFLMFFFLKKRREEESEVA